MQYYSGDWKLGIKSKSHRAEFSPNPDDRKKSEVKYHEYARRLKEEMNQEMAYRVEINKIRHQYGLEPFLDQETFNELIDDCDLKGEALWHYLCEYDGEPPKNSIEKPRHSLEVMIAQNLPVVSSEALVEYLDLDHKDFIEAIQLLHNAEVFYIEYLTIETFHECFRPIPIKGTNAFYITYASLLVLAAVRAYSGHITRECFELLDMMEVRYQEHKSMNEFYGYFRSIHEDIEFYVNGFR
ncbi:hypothetical protein WCX18_00785 [Sulfurimonas sp. HSL1-2]|uniref:hypothetical protein n=1 Tax=Thiomicrolovo zhangzhouensis TaxID=3131933 RepID=UPI0031F9AAE0